MLNDSIEHVIVLMLENRSFDHMLGVFQTLYPGLEGVPPTGPARSDQDSKTKLVYQQLVSRELQLNPSPTHEHPNVMRQIANNMSGFIDDYATVPNSKSEDYPAVMGYYPMDFLPVLHTLAKHFTICDHWFSSLPGPTWPNRFFVHSGTCDGHVSMPDGFYHPDIPALRQPQDTIYNRLQAKGISWGIFHHGLSQALLLPKLWDHPLHFHPIERFFEMCNNPDRTGYALPQYIFLEPAFRGAAENDQHPPADVRNGELLIASVYNAVRNSAVWEKTLLIVTYDEHGGFYDHVVPPCEAIPPDNHTGEFNFTQFGPRVPALLISPYAPKGFTATHFDHTSILRYLIEKWDLPFLTNRSAKANSIGEALDFTRAPRSDTPPSVKAERNSPVPVSNNAASVVNHEQGLLSFARYLDVWMDHRGEDAISAYERLQREYSGLDEKIVVASERFKMFLSGTFHHKKGIASDLAGSSLSAL